MPQQRTLDRATVDRMMANRAVSPVIARIGTLVSRAVFLETVAARARGQRPDLRVEAATLADGAREELRSFEQQLAALPEPVTQHPRVTDARRALMTVAERFERLRSEL